MSTTPSSALKVINLAVDYGIDREKQKDAPSDIENTVIWIGQAIALGYKEGLNTDKRRMWSRLQSEMEALVKAENPIFKLNEYELLFIQQAFEKAVVPSNMTLGFTKTESAVLAAKWETDPAE